MFDPEKVTEEGAFDKCYNVLKDSKAEAFNVKVPLQYLGSFELKTKNWDDTFNPREAYTYMALVKEKAAIKTQYIWIGVQNVETQ